jgi:hypothetical protein
MFTTADARDLYLEFHTKGQTASVEKLADAVADWADRSHVRFAFTELANLMPNAVKIGENVRGMTVKFL